MDIGLIVAIPYWQGDAFRVTNLSKLLVGLQDQPAGQKVLMIPAHRADCPPNSEAEGILRSKFTVLRHAGASTAVGYPMGANGLFQSFFTMTRYFYRNRCHAVLWLEPDAFPCRKDWIDVLLAAWARRRAGAAAIGNIFSIDGLQASLHLNGGALYHPAFVDYVPDVLECAKQAWDWEKRGEILRVSQDIPEIRYSHNARDMTEIPDPAPAIIHGVKDDSLLRLVMDRYKIPLT